MQTRLSTKYSLTFLDWNMIMHDTQKVVSNVVTRWRYRSMLFQEFLLCRVGCDIWRQILKVYCRIEGYTYLGFVTFVCASAFHLSNNDHFKNMKHIFLPRLVFSILPNSGK